MRGDFAVSWKGRMDMIAILARLAYPLALYYVCSGLAAAAAGPYLDAAALTALTALLVIPAAYWCFSREADSPAFRKKEEAPGWRRAVGPGQSPWLFAAAAGAGIVGNQVFTWLLNWLQQAAGLSNAAQESLLSSGWTTLLLCSGFLAPLAEELVFRGLLYGNLRRMLPKWPAVILGAAAFGIFHGNLLQFCYAFSMGILLNLFCERQKGLAAPALCHMAANLAALLMG